MSGDRQDGEAGPDAPGRMRFPPVAAVILVLCVLPELVLTGADLGLWGTARWRATAYGYGGFWAGLLGNWRPNYPFQSVAMFATYGFLHAGLIHLAVNMLTLGSLAPPLVARAGQRGFAIVYAAALVGGAAGFALLSRSPQPMVGASGALFGLAGAVLAWDLADRRRLGASLRPVLRALAILVALNLVLWWAMDGLLAWQTHLGGFVVGWAAAIALDRWHRPR